MNRYVQLNFKQLTLKIILMKLFVRWRMNKLAILEGLLFVVGDDGLTMKQICEIMELSLE